MKIPFNIPYISGNEVNYINDVIKTQSYSSAGKYNELCEKELNSLTKCENIRLTGSATAALEIAALAIGIKEGDEVILPSFTYVTTASAFVLRGAKIVFVDINPNTMCMDEGLIERAITSKTKAIVLVHYAGFTSNINKIVQLCKNENIFLIEDAAQSIDSYYETQHLGTFGDFGCISFHDTKNIHCGEGGALFINNKSLLNKVDVIIEKGTNRKDFLLGNDGTYSWKGLGSSYGLSEISAAFLLAQLEDIKKVTAKRKEWYNLYETLLLPLRDKGCVNFPKNENNHNAHIFFIKVKDKVERNELIAFLKEKDVPAYFHYLPLHLSDMGRKYDFLNDNIDFTLQESEKLVRLPLFYDYSIVQINKVVIAIEQFYQI